MCFHMVSELREVFREAEDTKPYDSRLGTVSHNIQLTKLPCKKVNATVTGHSREDGASLWKYTPSNHFNLLVWLNTQ